MFLGNDSCYNEWMKTIQLLSLVFLSFALGIIVRTFETSTEVLNIVIAIGLFIAILTLFFSIMQSFNTNPQNTSQNRNTDNTPPTEDNITT